MRRRALLSAASGIAAASLAGCVATSSAEYDLTVRDWQEPDQRTFPVHPDSGATIRVELQDTQSHGAIIEIYRPDFWDGERVFRGNPPLEYTVEETGKHTVFVEPTGAPGGGTSYAWVRIYVE